MGPGSDFDYRQLLRNRGGTPVTEQEIFIYIRRSVSDLRDLEVIMDLIHQYAVQQYRQGARDAINALKYTLLEEPEDDRNSVE